MFRLSGDIEIFSSTPAGTTIGRKLSEWGQIGVTIIAGTDGWIIYNIDKLLVVHKENHNGELTLAPAATAYAVLPVGVETMRPKRI